MNKTILVVDDEPDIQEILQAYLERIDGVEVVSVLSGEDAVEKYRELASGGDRPALVVMDLNLSGSNSDEDIIDAHRGGKGEKMDGVRTAEAIFARDSDTVIWGYTAWANTPWADRLRDAGAQKIVDRVVPFKEFAEMVAEHLQD